MKSQRNFYKECPRCEGDGRVLDIDKMLSLHNCKTKGHIWNGDPPHMFCDACGIPMPPSTVDGGK